MNLEMRRVVLEAERAARAGWSEQDVASLAESTRDLRCGDAEVARLLALSAADHGHREAVLMTNSSFHASVFALAAGETIPLHDHPGIDVISKVLRGVIRVRTYEWKDAQSLVASERGEVVLGENDEALVLRKSPGTLHTITAIEPSAFLDLFAPYYDEVERPCRYYKVVDEVADSLVALRAVSWEEARR